MAHQEFVGKDGRQVTLQGSSAPRAAGPIFLILDPVAVAGLYSDSYFSPSHEEISHPAEKDQEDRPQLRGPGKSQS
ncbi:MAG: hypothetical protein FJX77_12225 [Armatimonadetes bacterium]|nr:hypothetical protein [Armatimonadota bacterium]